MTTKEYLSQIGRLNRMIENKTAEIYQLRTIAYNATIQTNDSDRVQTSGDKDRLGNIVSEIVDTENEVSEMIKRRSKIVGQIESITDTDYYDILAKRYILGKDIKYIAVERDKSLRHIGRVHDRALKCFERIYGQEYTNRA